MNRQFYTLAMSLLVAAGTSKASTVPSEADVIKRYDVTKLFLEAAFKSLNKENPRQSSDQPPSSEQEIKSNSASSQSSAIISNVDMEDGAKLVTLAGSSPSNKIKIAKGSKIFSISGVSPTSPLLATLLKERGEGCTVTLDGHVMKSSPINPFIVGSGVSASRIWTIGKDQRFSGIRAHGLGMLEIVSGGADEVTVSADDNVIGKLTVSIKGDDLAIELEAKSSIKPTAPISYVAQFRPETLAKLTSIVTGIHTQIKTPLAAKKLFMSATDSALLIADKDLKIDECLTLKHNSTNFLSLARIATKKLMINHSGSGRLVIKQGRVEDGMFNILASGSVSAAQLIVNNLMLNMTSNGSLDCTVQEGTIGSITGSGCFSNYGQGAITGLQIVHASRYNNKHQKDEIR